MTTLPIYFNQRIDAQKAVDALEGKFLVREFPSQAPRPFQSRSWVIVIEADTSTRNLGTIQAIVNRYDGVIHQETGTTRPGGPPFMNSMPQEVIDRYERGS